MFRQLLTVNDASSKGLLALVFPTLTLPRVLTETLTRRSPPRLFTAAARAGLKPAPESRSRGAYPHLLCSFATRNLFTFYSFHASAAHIMSPIPPISPVDLDAIVQDIDAEILLTGHKHLALTAG